jgi:hypothetical protein
MGHFSGTQAEACQKEQYRIVTPSCGSSPIAGIDEAFDLLRLKELRQGRLLPVCYLGQGSSQVHGDLAPFIHVCSLLF